MTDHSFTEPQTAAGRQHVAEFDVGQFGRVKRAVLAIEDEARAALLDERDTLRRDFLEFAVHQDGCHLQSPCWCGYQQALDRVMSALGPKP